MMCKNVPGMGCKAGGGAIVEGGDVYYGTERGLMVEQVGGRWRKSVWCLVLGLGLGS